MKVSVIIPTYNRAGYICQALESVLNQTLADSEVIVVDDGSTDDTATVLKPYLHRIHYIHSDNHGPAHARNIGMEAAQGEYIAFLDSDDLYYPYKLELQAAVLDTFPNVDMVSTEFSAFDNADYWDECHLKKYHEAAYASRGLTYETIYSNSALLSETKLSRPGWESKKLYWGNIFDFYLLNVVIFTNSAMFRRNLLPDVGLQNTKYRLFEDFEFILRICKNRTVAFVDIPTYKLRFHTGQISRAQKKERMHLLLEMESNYLEIVETHGVRDGDYYNKHKAAVDRRLAEIHTSIAVPLIAKGNDPESARSHLRKSAAYGYPARLLLTLTYAPYLMRRLAIKILSL